MDDVEPDWTMTHHWHVAQSTIGPKLNSRGLHLCARAGLRKSSISTYYVVLQEWGFLLAASLELWVPAHYQSTGGNHCMFNQWIMRWKNKFYGPLRIHFNSRMLYILSKLQKQNFKCFEKDKMNWVPQTAFHRCWDMLGQKRRGEWRKISDQMSLEV